MAMTPERRKQLLESLFAIPDNDPKAVAELAKITGKKPRSEKAAKPAKTLTSLPVPVQRNRTFQPAVCIIEVVHQVCTTCGSEHSFVQSRRVRFEGKNTGELHTAFEVETVVPENLPRQVDNTYSTTNICPTCVTLSRDIDDFLCIQQPYVQMELFHG